MSKTAILIVDDEKSMCELLHDTLLKENYQIYIAETPYKAIEIIEKNNVDIVLLDLIMPGMDGIGVLREIKHIKPDTVVIMMTGYGTIDTAVEAMKLGAYDYITKPFRMSKIKTDIVRILEREQIVQENIILRQEIVGKYKFENIVGSSQKMQEVYQMIEKVADSDCNVLIQGESGTGKELIARAIHYNSLRKDKPFIAHSCAVLPENLLESELFGYVRGAFTGAVHTKYGLLEVANEGTFFLDEISTISPAIQSKLLRVVEEREFRKVGGTETIKVDIRLIVATNKDLRQAVEEGTFRDDLFYRLNVFTIFVPPLRERGEDIPLLANYFLAKYNKIARKQIKSISPKAMDIFIRYGWQGNVRELENIIERAVILENGDTILPKDLPVLMVEQCRGLIYPRCIGIPQKAGQVQKEKHSDAKTLSDAVKEAEKEKIVSALKATNGHKTNTAKLLGISRKTLWEKIKNYNINKE